MRKYAIRIKSTCDSPTVASVESAEQWRHHLWWKNCVHICMCLHTVYICVWVCACLWVAKSKCQCVFTQTVMILPGDSPLRPVLWQRHTHTHCNPLPRSTLSSYKFTIPSLLFTQASSTAIATSSVLESACLGNVCQGTDEWTHGTFSASSGTWTRRKSNEAGWGENWSAVSSQAFCLFIAKWWETLLIS